jgi:hypothetical protein
MGDPGFITNIYLCWFTLELEDRKHLKVLGYDPRMRYKIDTPSWTLTRLVLYNMDTYKEKQKQHPSNGYDIF